MEKTKNGFFCERFVKYFAAFCMRLVVLRTPLRAAAYEAPRQSYYRVCSTSELGDICIYFPTNLARYFSSYGSGMISTYSSTISCWAEDESGTQYDVRFAFDTIPQYRVNSSSYSYADLNITDISDTNLTFLNSTDFTVFSQDTHVSMIFLFIAGAILVTLLKRR